MLQWTTGPERNIRYIDQKSAQFLDDRTAVSSLKEMMKFCGYSKFNKFKNHRKEWDELHRDVPLSYFTYIGIKKAVLLFTLELDYEEYKKVLDIPLYPQFAVARVMAAVYQEKQFLETTPEAEAIEVLKVFSREKHKRCCINCPELKTIYVEPNGEVNIVYYPPAIKFTGKWALPNTNGNGIGTTYLG